jgi:hypothetical protein
MHLSSTGARASRQWAVARNRKVNPVPEFNKSRQQIEQAALSAAQLIELVQEEQALAHRTAIARTQKYTGSTRQYVNRSPESIWKSCPIQKQKIQVPRNEDRESPRLAACQAVRRIAKLSTKNAASPTIPVSTNKLRYMLSATIVCPTKLE